MKKFLIIFLGLVVVFLSMYYFKLQTSNIEEVIPDNVVVDGELIGGTQDEFGCLGPAGYSFDREINACIRSWEIDSDDKRKASRLAVEEVGAQKGLTIIEVLVARCPGCFVVSFNNGGERTFAKIEDWGVVEVSDVELSFETSYENMESDSEYFKGLLHKSLEDLSVADIRLAFPGFVDEDFDFVYELVLSDEQYTTLMLNAASRFGIDLSLDTENIDHLVSKLKLDSMVPVESDYGDKIVYGTNQSVDIDALRLDCGNRGGEFSECGSPCASDAEMCIDVCAFVCLVSDTSLSD